MNNVEITKQRSRNWLVVSGCHNLSDFYKQGSTEGESTRDNFSAETVSTAILLRFPHARGKQHFRKRKFSMKIKYHFENCRHEYMNSERKNVIPILKVLPLVRVQV